MKTTYLLKRIPGLKRLHQWRLKKRRQQERRDLAFSYYKTRLECLERWVTTSNETTNFTYDLHPSSYTYLASCVAIVTGVPEAEISRYISEILHDESLRRHVHATTNAAPRAIREEADPHARFSRRVGWYAVARATKPRIIVETGVDKGLGSVVLCAALMANAREGHRGRYYGTDINPEAGWLLCGAYAEFGSLLYGDSLQSLCGMDGPIDLFINDSDHSSDYERREYDLIQGKLSEHAVILGDNAHCNTELHDFSAQHGRAFLYWPEWPIDHWYPGCGIGFSFRQMRPSAAS